MVGVTWDRDVQPRKIKALTFLKQFLVDEKEILLICDIQNNVSEDEYIPVSKPDNSVSDDLDLTGTPLHVDLKGDDTLDVSIKCDRGNSWTPEEATFYPIPLDKARDILNRLNLDNQEQIPTYCICEQTEDESYVMLGSHLTDSSMSTCYVECIGLFPKEHDYLTINYMKNQHLQEFNMDVKVDCLLKWKYILYGYNLQSTKLLEHSETVGFLGIEVNSNNSNCMRMFAQVIAGHELSNIHFLWQELTKLQNYLDILNIGSPDIIEDINEDYKSEEKIIDELDEVINSVGFLVEEELCKEFDLNNLRQSELLDKLWDILKYCKDLSTLRDCFAYFFQELASSDNKRQVNDSDKSSIATIVRGIINGTVAVPTVTFTQALELLFELGTEKLFKDFLVIINYFYIVSPDNFLQKWNKFFNDISTQGIKRKTRITMLKKGAMTESAVNTFKLGYLGQMYISVELMYLLKDRVNVSEDTFKNFCENVLNKYLNKNTLETEFNDLLVQRLVEFDFPLSLDKTLVDSSSLSSLTAKMTSNTTNAQVTTVFNMSENPIFPRSIYDCDDMGRDIDEKLFYLSKYVKYTYPI